MLNARPFLLLAPMVACLLLFAGCGQNRTSVEHVSKAKEYMDKGEFRPAFIELSSAVQKDPKSVEGRWLLAKVAVNLGEGVQAEKEIKKAMELGLNRASSQITLVRAILLQGDLERVLAESSALMPDLSKADQAAILGLRGQAFVSKGQFDLAQQALEQAMQIKPDSLPALIGMTALHGYQRNYDVARQWVNKALNADASSADALSALGDLELAQGRLAEAEKAFDSAIKHRPTPYLEQAKRAQVRIRLKKFPEAAADIKTLQNAGFKEHPYVNYIAGLNAFAQKNYPEALTAFQASDKVEPSFLPNKIYLATTQHLLGNTEQALALAQQILANAPHSKTAKNLLGSVLISRAEYDGAKDVLQKNLTTAGNDPQALAMMANVAMLEGDTAKALEYANKLAALEPGSKHAQDLLIMAKLMAGEALDRSIGQAGKQAAADSDVYTQEFVRALSAFRSSRLKEALERAKALRARYPDKADPVKLIAACYLAAGQWDQAKPELEKVLKLQPNEPSATRNLAKIETIQGNFQRVRALLQPLLKTQLGDTESALLLASAETRLGNPAAGLEVLEQATKANPADLGLRARFARAELQANRPARVLDLTRGLTEAQYRQQPALLELRGNAQLLTGDGASAASTFEQWTKLAPSSAPAHFYYANALAGRGDVARARQALDRSIKLNPRYLPARIGEIKMLVEIKKTSEAKAALAKLRRDFGDRNEVLGIEGWFALGTSEFATAVQRLSEVAKRRPDSDTILLLARAHWGQKQSTQAINVMQSWLKAQPQDVAVMLQLSEGYMSLNREADARTTYEKVLQAVPGHVIALNNLAWLYRDQNLKTAIEYAEQAFRQAPKEAKVMDTLGTLLAKNGDFVRGGQLLRQAADLSPADLEIQLHLGQILLQQKQNTKAKEILSMVVAKAPATSRASQEAQAALKTLQTGKP